MIGAEHEFHDEAFVQGWADRFEPTPDRLALFGAIHSSLASHIKDDGCVVELGIGPGYLAHFLLEQMPDVRYVGLDFSKPMLGIAAKRLEAYADRVEYIQADLINEPWWEKLPTSPDAFVSTWSLHDLGDPEHIDQVYQRCFHLLPPAGVLLNGDFIKPDDMALEFEAGRFEVDRHLEMLSGAGFPDPVCLGYYEIERVEPTAAQNYALLKAQRG